MSSSHLDANQVLPLVLDESTDALQVNVVAGSLTATNPSVGITGTTAPTSATEVAGVNAGNLVPLSVDSSGKLNVNLSTATIEIGKVDQGNPNTAANGWPVKPTDGTNSQSFTASGEAKVDVTTTVLPPGAATSANQTTEITHLSNLDTNTIHVDTGNVTVISSSLPTGAATSANQTNGSQQTQIVQGGNTASVTASNALKVDGSAVTQPISGTVSATQSGTWTVQPGNTPNTTPWLTTINQGGNSASVTVANALKVDGSAVTQPVSGTVTANAGTGTFNNKELGFSVVNHARNDYTSNNVTTSAYTQIIASTASTAQEVEIFDSNGFTMLLAFGGSGSEVDQIYVYPGGNGRTKLSVPASTRISIKAVVQTANTGEFTINLYG